MKKNVFLLILCLLLLVGCGNNDIDYVDDGGNNDDSELVEDKLLDPVVKWCQVYNPNGFNTITCVVSNPNKIDIDINYDLVFYKDGKEVSRLEDYYNSQLSSKHDGAIWGNVNVPNPIDVDDVKMENIRVSKAYYDSLNANIKYVETAGNKAYFSVKHDKKPTMNDILFFLYNDNNKNGKCDKGELVVTSSAYTMEKEDRVYFETDVYKYTDYEIYYNAY